MENSPEVERVAGVWRLYATPERGWIALACLILVLFLLALFEHPYFNYRGPDAPGAVSLQLAFTVDRFRAALLRWNDIETFKRSVGMIDYVFPPTYAALLAFGYAWGRGNVKPKTADRWLFIAPFVAALCDWAENSLHLYLLRDVHSLTDAGAVSFPALLVFAASLFAAIKLLLLVAVAVVTLAVLLVKLVRNLPRVAALLPYAYILRIPLLTAAILIGLSYVAFFTAARSVLENLFDLKSEGIFWVTMAAFLAAWTVMATLRLTLLYGGRRFRVTPCHLSPTFGWHYLVRHGLLALPVVAGAILKSGRYVWGGYAGAVLIAMLGLAASVVVLWAATFFQRFAPPPRPGQVHVDLLLPSPKPGVRLLALAAKSNPAPHLSKWLAAKLSSLPAYLGQGYIDYRHGGGLPGHGLALSLFVVSLLLYAVIGIFKYASLGVHFIIPSLAYVLWLVLLLCWGLSALAFFFDRYRFPVLIPIALWLAFTAQFGQSDHYYHLTERQSDAPLAPDEAIQAGGQDSVIVVAASGGGIQAAAWTARVLTGLEAESRRAFGSDYRDFGRRIRLISSVSGGSTGTMYFVNGYASSGSGLPDAAGLEEIVRQASQSSLDEVAWGLVYPDLLRSIFPFFLGDGIDRGKAMEEAWRKAGNITARLSDWREDARRGTRPAIIFNATIADTGQRMLIATSDLRPDQRGGQSFIEAFRDQGVSPDISMTTAARLSATFPYVTPAARADLGGPGRAQFHVVDGGYYDNYGISSLAGWLDEALGQPGNKIKRVLVVQIRDSPVGKGYTARNQRGWFYQAFVPVSTLLHVRSAGQYAHNEVEFCLLRRMLAGRGVAVENAEFEFPGAGAPLSWHLTAAQKGEIERQWEELKRGAEWEKVKQFLSGAAPGEPDCGAK